MQPAHALDVRELNILLLSKPGLLKSEARLLDILRVSGYQVQQIDRLPERFPNGRTILMVDLFSTLSDFQNIQGYVDFLRAYWRLSQSASVRLVVIYSCPSEVPVMLGYGTLVDCYITETIAPSELGSFLQRLSEQLDKKATPSAVETANQ